MALNLGKPWFIKEIKMSVTEGTMKGQIDIFLDFEKGS
jgi:hypothetical protein